MVEILASAAIENRLLELERPISFHRAAVPGHNERMRRRQALDVFVDSPVEIEAKRPRQEIRNPEIVQLSGQTRRASHRVERIAHEPAVVRAPVKKRSDAELVARAEEAPAPFVPEDEAEIAAQIVDAAFAPAGIGAQTQERVCCGCGQERGKLVTPVEPDAAEQPKLAVQFDRVARVLVL